MKILCKILGHHPIDINRKTFTATCKRCEKIIRVCYNMTYGYTIVEGE